MNLNFNNTQSQVLEHIEYKHKKFDVSKRTRCDSSSSASSSLLDVITCDEATNRNSDTPFSIMSDYNSFQPCSSKRSRAETMDEVATTEATSPTACLDATQSAIKRRRYNSAANDSGLSHNMSAKHADDSVRSSTPHNSVYARYTSTPLSMLATVAAATTPLMRRRLNTETQSNDSGISVTTPQKLYMSSATASPAISARYTSSPLALLSAVASTTTAPNPTTPAPTLIMPKISDETMHNICKYHGNMVRKFPKKERTPKDQERRNKNTIACRMSRRLKKLEHVAVEEQYKDFSRQHLEIVEASMRAAAYLNALTMKLAALSGTGANMQPQLMKPALKQPKPFSIEYLTGLTNC